MAEGNGRTWSPDIRDLGDRIVTLTVAKAVELGDLKFSELLDVPPYHYGVVFERT